MAGPGICILGYADTCTSWVHQVLNYVALCRDLLHTVYLFMADIANTELFVCCCLNITHLYEEKNQRFRMAGLQKKITDNSGPHCWEREVSTQFAQQLVKTDVTAPLLVCCFVWRLLRDMPLSFLCSQNTRR